MEGGTVNTVVGMLFCFVNPLTDTKTTQDKSHHIHMQGVSSTFHFVKETLVHTLCKLGKTIPSLEPLRNESQVEFLLYISGCCPHMQC